MRRAVTSTRGNTAFRAGAIMVPRAVRNTYTSTGPCCSTSVSVPTTVPAGNILFTNNTTTCVENQEGQSLSYGKAYLDINACPVINEDDEYTLSILISESAADADGIQEALANISKTGNIYTTDGKLVRTNATLNDMKRLGQGTYILNGVKVFVK